MANRWGKSRNSDRFYFHGLKISVDVDWQPLNYKTFSPWKKNYDKPRQCIKKRRHHFANKSLYSQSYGFSSKHVQMWEWDHKEGWVPKNWSFWMLVLEKTLESPLNSKEIKLVNPKGNQPWIHIGRPDAVAEVPIFWPPDMKSRLIWKDPDAGKDWGQKEKGATEDEMVEWHHWLNGDVFGKIPGDSEGLACCRPWDFPGKSTGVGCHCLLHHSLSEKCKSRPQWGTISHQSQWLRSKSLQAINAGEGVEKREPSYTVYGNAN